MKNYHNTGLLLVSLILVNVSCACNSPVGNVENQVLWQTQIGYGSLIFADYPVSENANNVLFVGTRASSSVIYAIDKVKGTVKWEWSNWLTEKEDVLVKNVYSIGNTLIFQNAARTYAIDTESGKTIWRIQHGGTERLITGLGRNFFFASQLRTISQGNIQTGSYVDVFSIPDEIGSRASIKTPVPFFTQNGDTMLITTRGGLRLADATAAPTYLMLYNLSRRVMVYDSLQPNSTSSILPIVVGSKVYLALGATIQCNDVTTGRVLWQRTFTSGFLFGGVNVSDGKVFVGCEDTNFYCLGDNDGQILWQLNKVGGGVSKPFIMNSVVYFAPGLLYAVDVNSGQTLWKQSSPDGEGFFGQITGSEGKIYVQSYKSAYCYKAAR
jgi:outer membrane protein assembly factor BamB